MNWFNVSGFQESEEFQTLTYQLTHPMAGKSLTLQTWSRKFG